jgi:N6-L-threonylcarbamoyladenine synthase
MILAFLERRWRVFGETLDITIGQLLDQFGRAMGFASPCGARIEKLATESSGNYLHLPYVVKGNDVSFSGMLTASINLASSKSMADVCYSLQETSFAMLAEAVERALSFTTKKEMMIVGGVSANLRLVQMLASACERQGSTFHACPTQYAGDNGAQIAWTAIQDYRRTKRTVKVPDAFVTQSWRLDTVDIAWR